MSEFIRTHKESLLVAFSLIGAVSILFILFYSGSFNLNPIPAEENKDLNYITNPLFIMPFVLFTISLITIFLIIFTTRSKEYMMGDSNGKYKNKKEILEGFLDVVIRTNSKVTDKNYTLHLLKKIKKENDKDGFKNIEITNKKPFFKVIDAVNYLPDKKFTDLIQVVIEGFSSSGDSDDPFLAFLRNETDNNLSKALGAYGIIIED